MILDEAERICSDRVSGSSELALKTIDLAIRGLGTGVARRDLERALHLVMKTFKEMISVKNVVSLLLKEIGSAEDDKALETIARLRELKRQLIVSKEKIASNFLYLLDEIGGKLAVMTLSRSSTVLGCLRKAADKGFIREVYVAESNPLSEGKITVAQLRENGVKATLIHDLAIGIYSRRVDLGVTGADAVLLNGSVINKLGTYMLALALKEGGKPFYVATDTLKVDFSRDMLRFNRVPEKNLLFEPTPASLIDAIICEMGILRQPLDEALENLAKKLFRHS